MSDTQETSTQAIRLTGQVKWFNKKAGFGFITVCDNEEHLGKDIFVHYKSINVENSQYRYLVQGEYVEFLLVKPDNDKYEFHAVNVTGIKGGAIMCENRRAAQEKQATTRPERQPVRRYRTNFQRRRGPPRQQQGESSAGVSAEQADQEGFEKVVRKRENRQPRRTGGDSA